MLSHAFAESCYGDGMTWSPDLRIYGVGITLV